MLLTRAGAEAWRQLEVVMPGAALAHRSAVRSTIASCWQLPGYWTSGIVNLNNALPYHRDGGNLAGALSAMICLRRNVTGGYLHLADYDVWLGVPDHSLVVFYGSRVLHGVSPLSVRPGGRRYTAVFYARAGLRVGADTPAAEVRRAQLVATAHTTG
jgi:hypothetical protein